MDRMFSIMWRREYDYKKALCKAQRWRRTPPGSVRGRANRSPDELQYSQVRLLDRLGSLALPGLLWRIEDKHTSEDMSRHPKWGHAGDRQIFFSSE